MSKEKAWALRFRGTAALNRAVGRRELQRIHPTAETHFPPLDDLHAFVVDDEPDARDSQIPEIRAQVTSFACPRGTHGAKDK